MLEFEPFTKKALKKALPYVRENPSFNSDTSAGYTLMWHKDLKTKLCVWQKTFVAMENIGEQVAFSYPVGEKPDEMIDELIKYVYDKNLPLRFFAIDEKTLVKMRQDKRLSSLTSAYDRRWSDYIYSYEDATSFKGGKFAGQRNHINKFKKLYGEPCVRSLNENDEDKVLKMLAEYKKAHFGANSLEKTEFKRAEGLLKAYSPFGLYAAGLFIGDKNIGVSVSEIVGETLIIHVEKALTRYEGVYPTLYSYSARLVGEISGKKIKYINREDDSGDAGLRTSKTQYHPLFLSHKYLVHVNSPSIKMPPDTVLRDEKTVLTKIREGDKRAYTELNTDLENNRYWGYDYREDKSIIGEVNEDTFYNSVAYDNAVGDSINFAIRENENGEMIGEVVLWNFTAKGFAELGCRLFKKYQGKGYGKAAFKLAADFAENVLKIRIVARCYRENVPSYKMITSNNFALAGSDDDYFYFKRNIN